jgi:hypothetical protein
MVDKDFNEDDVQGEVDSYQSIKKEKVSKQIIFMPLEHILPLSNFMDFIMFYGFSKLRVSQFLNMQIDGEKNI